MNTLTPQQPEQHIFELPKDSTTEQPMLSIWHKPTITRIDIKRTMNGGGSHADCASPDFAGSCP